MAFTRRALLTLPTGLLATKTAAAEKKQSDPSSDQKSTTLVNLIGTLHSPFDAWWSKGGALCAAAFKLPYTVLQHEGRFSDGLDQLTSIIAKTNGNMVLNLDAPSSPDDLKKLDEICSTNKIYFVTQLNIPPPNLRPWNVSPYYVAHIDFDERLAALQVSRRLINAMGGEGGIIALAGKADTPSTQKRVAALRAALAAAPNCYLLAEPVDAEWEASAAYDITRSLIAAHDRKKIRGLWAANDDMALGAIEALHLYNLAIPVTGMEGAKDAISAIQTARMTATVAWDSFWQGGIGLSLAFCAKTGLIVPAEEPHSHRAFYAPFRLITADNALAFVEYRDSEHPLMDWKDFWGPSTGAIGEQ